jgi:hypothetical protein
MKRLTLIILTLGVVSLGIFSSCSKDEDPVPPTVTINILDAPTYTAGTSVVFQLIISSNEDLVSFWAEESVDSDPWGDVTAMIPDEALDIDSWQFDNGLHAVTLEYTYNIPATGIEPNSEVTISWEIEDKEATAKESRTFTIVAGAGPIDSYTAVLLGSHENASVGSFYSIANNAVYTVAQAMAVQPAVDFIYFYGATNEATIAAPDDTDAGSISVFGLSGWTTMNATRFAATTVAAADFDAIADDATIVAEATGADATKTNHLAVDQVFAFMTDGGKKGLVKVAAITAGSDGTITLEIKVQQ